MPRPRMTRPPPMILLLIATLLLATGCSNDRRLAQQAIEAAERQARQSEAVTKLNEEVASGTRRLVEAQALARADADAERHQLSAGWDALEAERKQIAGERRTESLLAAAAQGGGLLLVVLFSLAVAVFALRTMATDEAVAEELSQVLISHWDLGQLESLGPELHLPSAATTDATPQQLEAPSE